MHGKAKIGQLDMSLRVDEDVVALNISMNSILRVQCVKSEQQAATDISDVLLRQRVFGRENVRQRASIHVLHDDVDAFVPPEALVKSHDAGVMTSTLKLDFVLNVLVIVLGTHLDGNLFASASLRSLIAR